jgi:hypothetical protein
MLPNYFIFGLFLNVVMQVSVVRFVDVLANFFRAVCKLCESCNVA